MTKNLQFTRLLKAGDRLREFNFRRSSVDGNTQFNIDVTDDRNNRISFQLQNQEKEWKIQPRTLPEWILDNEAVFHEIIEEELQS
jgi:hypothetical protein